CAGILLLTVAMSMGCARTVRAEGTQQQGIASIYKDHRTASGERYRADALCAAHRSLPFGSLVKVTHAKTRRSVIVRINDRGPFKRGRSLDLTPAAAKAIGLTWKVGITKVEMSVLRRGNR